jgi:predicted patatin/cPLA2 family phospholipase
MSEAALRTVLEVLIRRKRDGYVAGHSRDDDHVALAVEGGGMRGVASGGMVSALEDLGLTECFDSIHGSSAGAAAAAYFCCGEANSGTRIYYEDLTDKRFIDMLRLFRGLPIMDTSYLVDYVMQHIKPVNYDGIVRRQPCLRIVMTDIDSGQPFSVDAFDSYEFYRACLKASLTLPFIAGGPIRINGRRFMDGGLVQQIPIKSAMDVGATKVLSLMTRRADEQVRPEFSWSVVLQSKIIQAIYGGVIGPTYRRRNAAINETIKIADEGYISDQVSVGTIRLHHEIDYIHRLTQDPEKLRRASEASKKHVLDVFREVIGVELR